MMSEFSEDVLKEARAIVSAEFGPHHHSGGTIRCVARALTTEREKLARADEEIARLQDELDEAQQEVWPDWARKVLAVIRSHTGYDGYDDHDQGVDLPAELSECLDELHGFAEQRYVEARVKHNTDSAQQAAEHYRVQADDLREKLAGLVEASEKALSCMEEYMLSIEPEWDGSANYPGAIHGLRAAIAAAN